MELKETVFWNEDVKIRKMWEDKDHFGVVQEKLKDIDKELKDIGIEKIYVFDELGESWDKWIVDKGVGLCVLPMNEFVEQNSTTTKEGVRSLKLTAKEKYVCIDMIANENSQQNELMVYYPNRNIVISKVNLFADEKVYKLAIEKIKALKPKYKDQEEVMIEKMEQQWKRNFTKRVQDTKNKMDSFKRQITDYERNHRTACKNLFEERLLLHKLEENEEDVGVLIKEELSKLKKMDVVQNLKITDKIYFDFGEISLTGNIQTGTEVKEGVEVAKHEIKKVKIGKITFGISEDGVTIQNPSSVAGYPHPHADEEHICYGDGATTVNKLISNFEITKLINFLFSWVYSYNEGDSYHSLQDFYEARKNEEE